MFTRCGKWQGQKLKEIAQILIQYKNGPRDHFFCDNNFANITFDIQIVLGDNELSQRWAWFFFKGERNFAFCCDV